jgi:hypothetical protein
MIKRIKISQLPAAGAAQGADVMPVVQSGVTRKQTQSAVEQNALSTAQGAAADASQALSDAASAQGDATQALSDAAAAQADATLALNALPDKSDRTTERTGNVTLTRSGKYGSKNSPESGANVTVNITGASIDAAVRMYHQHSAEPTINVSGTGAGSATKYGAGIYDPSKVNIIGFWFDGNGNVGYGILPEQ